MKYKKIKIYYDCSIPPSLKNTNSLYFNTYDRQSSNYNMLEQLYETEKQGNSNEKRRSKSGKRKKDKLSSLARESGKVIKNSSKNLDKENFGLIFKNKNSSGIRLQNGIIFCGKDY